jgi:Putative Actinobacterial Holin-X, holin superfamily III
MAIVQAALALISRSLGRIVSAIFGWAVVALFGQTDGREKTALSALVGAAALWPILVLGIAVPKIAVFALSFVPLPEWVPKWIVRAVWIVLAAAVPFAVGITMAARQRRPGRTAMGHFDAGSGQRESAITRLLRGFPITLGIAAAFLVVFVTVPVLRVISFVRRRIDVHVPLVTDANSYGAVAAKVVQTLVGHGFSLRDAPPGWWMTVPSRILLGVGGAAFRDYIPQRVAYFRGDRLEVALYPNALLLRGSEQDAAWAHGVVVEALTEAPALQTFDPGAQDVERQIRRVWSVFRENPSAHTDSTALISRLGEIARDIAELPVPYDEWQIVYRQALQLDRAVRGERQLLEPLSKHDAHTTAPEVQEERMDTLRSGESARQLSNRELIHEITDKASTLVKKEIELAKAEIRADLQSELRMAKALAVAGIAALLGLNALLVAGILALATIIPGWAAALIVGGAVLGIAVLLGYVGWRRHVTNPLALTRQTLKEDLQWMKERAA